MTKELAASAPSRMKIKVVTPPVNVIPTVGTKTLPRCGSVVPPNVPVACRVGGEPRKTAGPACEKRLRAAHCWRDQGPRGHYTTSEEIGSL